MFCRDHIFLDCLVISKQSVHHLFFGWSVHRQSSSGHVPCGTHSCICTCFCTHVNFFDCTCDRISDRVHNCTSDLFGWSRVRFPDLAAWSFCGSRVQFPDPDHLFSGPLYPWPMSLTPTIRGSGWLCGKNKTSMRKKNPVKPFQQAKTCLVQVKIQADFWHILHTWWYVLIICNSACGEKDRCHYVIHLWHFQITILYSLQSHDDFHPHETLIV